MAIVTGKTLKIQDTKTPEPESVEVGGSIPPGSLQEEVKTSTPKKEGKR